MTLDSRMRTTCPMGTSYRPSTKDARNSASSAAARTAIHSAARRSAAVRGMVCLMGVPPFRIVVQSFILHRYSFSRNTSCSVLSHFCAEIGKQAVTTACRGGFRAPARPTFVNSDKSRQKHRKEPPAPSLPSALCSVRTCDCIPHVHVKFPFSLRCRIVSAPAPLPLIPTPNNAFGSTVESMSGSGARRKSIRHTQRNQPCPASAW